MSSSTDLPPYQEKPSSTQEITAPSATSSSLAGTVQTCSIKDGQTNYFSIIRVSDSTYHLSLTVDPTPLYRIELVLGPSKVGNIQIYSASDNVLLAAAHASTDQKSKTLPVGTICTSSPTEPDASWRPVSREKGFFARDFDTQIPIVTVPGRPAKSQPFKWRIEEDEDAFLFWEGDLPKLPSWVERRELGSMNFVFAIVSIESDGETVLEIRRGGGIEFELSVILHAFLLVNLNGKAKSA